MVWKKLWKVWITLCSFLSKKELCKFAVKGGRFPGKARKVSENRVFGELCRFLSGVKNDEKILRNTKKRTKKEKAVCRRRTDYVMYYFSGRSAKKTVVRSVGINARVRLTRQSR